MGMNFRVFFMADLLRIWVRFGYRGEMTTKTITNLLTPDGVVKTSIYCVVCPGAIHNILPV